MHGENQAVPARERTPLESFAQRIETLTDRVRESRGTLNSILDRIIGNEDQKNAIGQDRPEAGPGEYNIMNYAIDTLCNTVDTLQETVTKMNDRL